MVERGIRAASGDREEGGGERREGTTHVLHRRRAPLILDGYLRRSLLLHQQRARALQLACLLPTLRLGNAALLLELPLHLGMLLRQLA